jgi:hypothetical protein
MVYLIIRSNLDPEFCSKCSASITRVNRFWVFRITCSLQPVRAIVLDLIYSSYVADMMKEKVTAQTWVTAAEKMSAYND